MASILLFNTSFQNRGDALMVRALQERVGPGHDWSVIANVAAKSSADTRELKICVASDLPGETLKQRMFNGVVEVAATALRLMPRSWRQKTRFTLPEDIDVAFDLSGYCFGDFWGQPKVEQATRNYQMLRQCGAKVVLLPRTLGPFAEISSQSLERMFEQVDLAFARDLTSLKAINDELSPTQQAKISFAPDYTHAVKPRPMSRVDFGDQRIAWLVPNHCVLTSGTLSRDEYARLLGIAREEFAKAGLRPKLLLHETSNDLDFLRDAERIGFAKDEIFITEDAVDAKTLISGASAVVTSSLHALYNALNNLVPVTVIPWNFKYGEALGHYHCSECLVDMARPESSLRETVQLITDPQHIPRLKEAMRAGKQEQIAKTEAMWARIFAMTGLEDGATATFDRTESR